MSNPKDVKDRDNQHTWKVYKEQILLHIQEIADIYAATPAHSGKLCSYCGYELPNHEDRCKNKMDLLNWLNNECPQGTMTADLSHDFAEILRGKLDDILLTGTIPASKDNTVINTGE